jgi:hypothetical protein
MAASETVYPRVVKDFAWGKAEFRVVETERNRFVVERMRDKDAMGVVKWQVSETFHERANITLSQHLSLLMCVYWANPIEELAYAGPDTKPSS